MMMSLCLEPVPSRMRASDLQRRRKASRLGAARVRRSLTALVAILPLASAPALLAEQDAGASYNLLLKAPLKDDWFLISRSNLASRNNFEDEFLAYTGLGIGYQLTPSFSLRLGYRRAWFRFTDDWQAENRGYLEGYFADRIGGFRVTNRARVEVRTFDWRSDDVRLRNEITVEAPWELTPLRLTPYLEEEIFYSTSNEWIEANWLGGGLAWRPAKGVKLKLGYRWNRFRAGDDWANRNVLVTGINVFF
jgi:opacity protein-like surface antigen